MAKEKKFPKEFIDMIGEPNAYRLNGKVKFSGIVVGLRWSLSYIKNMKSKEEHYGIDILFQTEDRKYKWTTAFNSGVLVKK